MRTFMPKTAALTRLIGVALLGLLLVPAPTRAQDVVVYYHTDAIGSVRATTDATGALIDRYDFLPFGEAWQPPTTPDKRQFAGKERDPETGLDYFGARYHMSTTGRFTTVDPVLNVEAAMTDPQRWNRYAYVRNNPFVFIDPDGRDLVRGNTPFEQAFMRQAGAIRDSVANALGAGSSGFHHPLAVFGRDVVDSVLSSVLPRNGSELADSANAAILGMAGPMQGRLKPVGLPAWRTVAVDMEEVISGHTSTGMRAVQSGMKSIFPEGMTIQQIEGAIRNAYRYGKNVGGQGDRVMIRGPWDGGTIELWLNRTTKTIETAYPLR